MYKNFGILTLPLVCVLMIGGCTSRSHLSSLRSFIDSKQLDGTELINFSIPKIAKYHPKIRRKLLTSTLDGTQYADIEVKFENIDLVTCENLRNDLAIDNRDLNNDADAYYYKSDVICIEGLTYMIEDFLPPLVSALKGKGFNTKDEVLYEMESNCWNTAYEFARLNRDGFSIYFAQAELDFVFRRTENTETVFETDYCPQSCASTTEKLAEEIKKIGRLGDIIRRWREIKWFLIYPKMMLAQ